MSAQPNHDFDWKILPGISNPKFIVIDLFCGAGGTSTGYKYAKYREQMCAIVAAAINHDEKALKSHWENNMEVVHFNEDITKLYGEVQHGFLFQSPVFRRLIRMVEIYRAFYPNAKIILWASLECTNFSKAKGGQARNADSRTLAEHLDRYIAILQPDYIKIENVVEFMAWGPMRIKAKKVHNVEYPYTELALIKDKKSKQQVYGWEPISKKNGQDWMKWRESICNMGYLDKWDELNSADYGAYTARNRLFGIFHRPELPAAFPKATHTKNPGKELSLFTAHKKWNAVKEVLEFEEEGESILNRMVEIRVNKWVKQKGKAKEKVYNPEKTRDHAKELLKTGKTVKEVILLPAGTDNVYSHHPLRFVIQQSMLNDFENIVEQYTAHYGSVTYYFDDKLSPKTCERVYSGLIKYVAGIKGGEKAFLQQTYACASNNDANFPIDSASRVVTTRDSTQLVQAQFLSQYNSGAPDSRNTSVEEPCRSLLTENTFALVNPNFITKAYSGKPDGKSIPVTGPAGTITTVDGQSLVQPKFIVSSNGGNPSSKVSSVENPGRVITTADNKQLVQPNFIVQRNSGDPDSRVVSLEGPARALTSTGGNQELVQPEFILNYNHTSEHNGIDKPAPTLVAADKLALVQPAFLANYNGRGENIKSVDEPAGTITTKDRFVKIQTVWLDKQYTRGDNTCSIESPAGTLMTHDKHQLVQPEFINRPFSSGGDSSSIEDPAGSLLSVPKLNLVQTKFIVNPHFTNAPSSVEGPLNTINANRKHHLLMHCQYNNVPSPTDKPCFTLIASMDKYPPYLITTSEGYLAIELYDDDSEIVIKIKQFMAMYGISDIKMRMLFVRELLKIQGFPGNYYLEGSQADKKKFIGNSVVPHVVRCWAEQLARELELSFPDLYLNAA